MATKTTKKQPKVIYSEPAAYFPKEYQQTKKPTKKPDKKK